MKAIGSHIVIEHIPDPIKRTTGGLELNEKVREDIRYRKGRVIALGHLIDIDLSLIHISEPTRPY